MLTLTAIAARTRLLLPRLTRCDNNSRKNNKVSQIILNRNDIHSPLDLYGTFILVVENHVNSLPVKKNM